MKAYKTLVLSLLVAVPAIWMTSGQWVTPQPAATDVARQVEAPELLPGEKVYDPDQPFVKPDDATLYKQLPIESFAVTQRCGTENPFNNAYWDHKEQGIYVDIVSGEPLFDSEHKYDSGTGWPSFWKPIDSEALKIINTDGSFDFGFEIKSVKADSHLGHVFNDGPAPSNLRFCVNSAALKFIPLKDMERLGYGHICICLKNDAL